MASDLVEEQILALRNEGMEEKEIAATLGVDELLVKSVTGSSATEREIREMMAVVRGLARDENAGGFVRLKAATWIVDEHKGRNDKKNGVVVNLGALNLAAMNDLIKRARSEAFAGLEEPAPTLDIESAPQKVIDVGGGVENANA
jgi:DNA-binding CsgD family transcriptional regulator